MQGQDQVSKPRTPLLTSVGCFSIKRVGFQNCIQWDRAMVRLAIASASMLFCFAACAQDVPGDPNTVCKIHNWFLAHYYLTEQAAPDPVLFAGVPVYGYCTATPKDGRCPIEQFLPFEIGRSVCLEDRKNQIHQQAIQTDDAEIGNLKSTVKSLSDSIDALTKRLDDLQTPR